MPTSDSYLRPATGAPWRRAALALAVALVAALATAFAPGLRLLEERARDALTGLALAEQPVPQVLVVDISEASLAAVGTWPWSRGRIADLVEQLLGPLGARAVALDMVLPEAADAAGDARLASLAQHGPLALAQVLDFAPRAVPIMIGTPAGAQAGSGSLPQATGFVANHAGLAQARCVGHIGVAPDADGVLRRVYLRAQAAGRIYPTLSLALLECADPAQARAAESALRGTAQGGWRIPFRRGIDAFSTLPAEAVLRGEVDADLVRGRFVLIGSSAVGLSDYVATPLQPVTAGVLVHAQVLAELLQPPQGLAASVPGGLLSLLALAGGLGLIAWGFAGSVKLGFAATALLLVAWPLACAAGFAAGAGPRVLAPLAGFAGFALSWTALDFIAARRLSRRALNTLSHYVAEPVLRLLVKQGLERTLAPARREITVLVADMAGYTRLTAESSLEESAQLTTQFLEAITPPVLEGGGTLDRYTGDGLIAFWGAPLARDDHAGSACAAARRMLEAVRQLNTRRAAAGQPPLAMRIGIESGEALVGDLGSSARSVYTAVGTCINLASRLQEMARDIGEVLVVGPQAAVRLGPQSLRPLGPRAIRGMAQPIEVYGLPYTTDGFEARP